MLGHRALSVDDYFAILKRRGWMIALPAILLALVGFGLTFVVTPRFVSQTLILVEQQKVPDEYVKPVLVEDLTARLASMKEQILSRSRLEPIITRFNLYGTGKVSMDDRIDETRKNIDIKPIHSEMATGGLPGFFISFKDSDPHVAQQVCGEIASLFVTANLNARAESAQGTNDFLKAQLDDAKRALDDQDAKLAAFQQKYMGRLPGEETPNMNMLTSLNTQLDAATQAINRMEQDKTYMEALLLQQQSMNAQVAEHGGSSPSALQAQLQQLQAEEADLTRRYTDDYPDVIAVRRKIKEVHAKIDATPPPAPTPTTPAAAPSMSTAAPNRNDTPTTAQLRAQLRGLEQGLTSKRHEQALIQNQVRLYQDRISSSPAIQEEYKTLTRDYQTAQQFYTELLTKRNQSKMAIDLERRQQGEQFSVMDQPNLPDGPTYPKRGVFVGGGLMAGLALGLMFVAWREYRDTALRSERDVWAFTKLPTLGVISFSGEVMTSSPVRNRRRFGKRRTEIKADKPLTTGG